MGQAKSKVTGLLEVEVVGMSSVVDVAVTLRGCLVMETRDACLKGMLDTVF